MYSNEGGKFIFGLSNGLQSDGRVIDKDELVLGVSGFKEQTISITRPAKLIELHSTFVNNCLMGLQFYDS